MLVTKLGEFGLIERFRKLIKLDSSVIKGPGDDCAVLEFNKNNYLLLTCDMVVEGVDFHSGEKPDLIGRKALAVSISDIAACAGIGRYAVVSMGIPKKVSVEFIDRVFKGMLNLADKYKINIVGGDISRLKQLSINVSMLGVVEKKYLVLRSGAKVGDTIFVSGEFGGSLLGKHLKFTPRLKESRFLVKNFKVNAMIDASDGLAWDLSHILKESKAGAVIYEDLIPQSKQAANFADALYGGEDFELIFTLSPKDAERLRRLKRRTIFKPIGKIIERKYGLRLVDKKGREKIIQPKGFQHF